MKTKKTETEILEHLIILPRSKSKEILHPYRAYPKFTFIALKSPSLTSRILRSILLGYLADLLTLRAFSSSLSNKKERVTLRITLSEKKTLKTILRDKGLSFCFSRQLYELAFKLFNDFIKNPSSPLIKKFRMLLSSLPQSTLTFKISFPLPYYLAFKLVARNLEISLNDFLRCLIKLYIQSL